MNAMILAAGLGTRLRPLTENVPKALVPIAGKPLLEIILDKLIAAGFTYIALNTHHHADRIAKFLRDYPRPGHVAFYVSFEEKLLDTGGGIKRMAQFFMADEPVLVHNVDILSNFDLTHLVHVQQKNDALCTLAIQKRKTERALLFDDNRTLCGRGGRDRKIVQLTRRPHGAIHFYEFCGVQVITPAIFVSRKENIFSSTDLYLRNSDRRRIIGHPLDGCYWRDLGTFDDLAAAEKDIKIGRVAIE